MTLEVVETKLTEAEELIDQGKHEEAEQLCREVLESLSGDDGLTLHSRALWLLSYSLYNRGRFTDALPIAEEELTTAQQAKNKLEQAKAMNMLGNLHVGMGTYTLALEYLVKALAAYEELDNKEGVAGVTVNIGSVHWGMGTYALALEYLFKALAAFEELGNKAGTAHVTNSIGNVHADMGSYTLALEYLLKALAATEEVGNKEGTAGVTANIGGVYADMGSYALALEYLVKALGAHEELGMKAEAARVTGTIGGVHADMGCYALALEYFGKALAAHEELCMKVEVALVTANIGLLYAKKEFEGFDTVQAEEILLKALAMDEELGAKKQLYGVHKALAELYEQQERWEEAHHHFKKYHEVFQEVQSEEATQQAQLMEHRRKVEEAERDRQINLARFQEREKILDNILPSQITERLIKGEQPIADKAENVSVFFSDIVGFTLLSQKVSAKELVTGLNELFIQYDTLAKRYGLEKIKTIGDAYMAVCGVPLSMEDHAVRTAQFALGVHELFAEGVNIAGHKVKVRIGLHCGEVVAGVIGEQKFAYDLWGDAVNTASRMESHGEAGRIHVSEEFVNQLTMDNGEWIMKQDDIIKSLSIDNYQLSIIPRGEMEIKGKGTMRTYFLERI